MIVTTKELFQHAYGKYAVGAYNINNLEQTVGLFRGNLGKSKSNEEPVNAATSAPFIIQISRGARGYTDKRFLEAMIRTADEVFPEAIFAVHLDHGTEEVCYDCIDSGFYCSVMIDASHETFEKNIEITRRVVERAHAKGIVGRGRTGQARRRRGRHRRQRACLTDPDQAVEFVEKSGCDSLAVAIGTSHGAYKFTGKQGCTSTARGDPEAAARGFPLVMHGSSSVPKEWVDRINEAGGKMKTPAACPKTSTCRPPSWACRKVNIDTDGRLVWCAIHREAFRDKPDDFDLRPPASRSWPPTPSTSSTRTRSSARPANWKRFERRCRSASLAPSALVNFGCHAHAA